MRLRGLMALSAIASSTVVGVAPDALAHPGHGLDSSGVGLLHHLLDLSHGGKLVVLALVVAAVAITLAEARRSEHR